MTSNDLILSKNAELEKILFESDLASLSSKGRITYVQEICNSLGLNFLSRPFDFIKFQGKVVLYANKGCAEQLRRVHNISLKVTNRETIEGVHIVTVKAWNSLREDESSGAVSIVGLKGIDLANALMKAETKAKRRATLSICSLNILDESEIDHLRAYTMMKMNYENGDVVEQESYVSPVKPLTEEVQKMVDEVKKRDEEKVNSDHLLVEAKNEFAKFYKFSQKHDNCHTFDAFKKLYAIDSIKVIEAMDDVLLRKLIIDIELEMNKMKKNEELNG